MKYFCPLRRKTGRESCVLYFVNCPILVLKEPLRRVRFPIQAMSLTFKGFSSELNQSSELSSEEIANVYFPEEIKNENERLF